MQDLIRELNRIVAEEIGSLPKHECQFCEKKSANREWMAKHIVSHLKKCVPVCKECGVQHIPDWLYDMEEILESHTETVEC